MDLAAWAVNHAGHFQINVVAQPLGCILISFQRKAHEQ